MPPDGGLLYGLGVADLRADPRLFCMPITTLLRFAYQHGNVKGPEIKWVLGHIEQLKPVIEKNSDIIFILQAGFIGMWGEWHGDTHNDDLRSRAQIMAKILELVPEDRL